MEITANQAYRRWLNAEGPGSTRDGTTPDVTSDKPKKSFKDWLNEQKQNGTLDSLLHTAEGFFGGGNQGQASSPTDQTNNPPPLPPSSPANTTPPPTKIAGLPVWGFIGVAILGTGLIVAGIVYLVKKTS